HLDVALRVDVESHEVLVETTHHVASRPGGGRRIRFDAVDLLDLEVEGDGTDLDWAYDGRSIVVGWSEPFARGETRTVRLRYRVKDPVSGFFFSHPTPSDPAAPRFAVTDHETERARHWL